MPGFERLLWFACRGNVFLRHEEIMQPLEDPVTVSAHCLFTELSFSIQRKVLLPDNLNVFQNFLFQNVYMQIPMLVFAGGSYSQECFHHILSRRTAEIKSEENL